MESAITARNDGVAVACTFMAFVTEDEVALGIFKLEIIRCLFVTCVPPIKL
jgi:hypothetical protein